MTRFPKGPGRQRLPALTHRTNDQECESDHVRWLSTVGTRWAARWSAPCRGRHFGTVGPVTDETHAGGVQQAVDRLIELGLVTAEAVAERLTPMELAEPLDYFGEPASQGALGLLDSLDMTYSIEHDTLRIACKDGVADYESELGFIAAASGGMLAITDVTLVDDDAGDHLLRFRCNGAPHEWKIWHDDDERLDAQITFAYSIDDLVVDGSPARWCQAERPADEVWFVAVFADPSLLNQFGAPYGLTFSTTNIERGQIERGHDARRRTAPDQDHSDHTSPQP